MCKDSLLSLKQNSLCSLWKKRVVPLGLHYTAVQTCNIAYRTGNSLQRSWVSVLRGEEPVLERGRRSCQLVFHVPVCTTSVYTVYNIKLLHAFGCGQISVL